ncbi:hypothetical protein H920_02512 [Fukomys damarensis]|uniref:Uncharacterized protein n=1 Tax=Fukomys damarensis TaxID=885580 RepID=A0A091E0C1_FUKDA|nr:hypothetical protein H920_02512 [Fukomys damarensis]
MNASSTSCDRTSSCEEFSSGQQMRSLCIVALHIVPVPNWDTRSAVSSHVTEAHRNPTALLHCVEAQELLRCCVKSERLVVRKPNFHGGVSFPLSGLQAVLAFLLKSTIPSEPRTHGDKVLCSRGEIWVSKAQSAYSVVMK